MSGNSKNINVQNEFSLDENQSRTNILENEATYSAHVSSHH